MPKDRLILCEGLCFTIEWGRASNGRCQAQEYYEALAQADRAKALALFKRMADVGRIYDTTKFNQETEKLYVFKSQPHRFFCFFMKGRRIFVVSAYQKQGQKAPAREIERAERIRQYCLDSLEQGGER
jgi:phage-related protein